MPRRPLQRVPADWDHEIVSERKPKSKLHKRQGARKFHWGGALEQVHYPDPADGRPRTIEFDLVDEGNDRWACRKGKMVIVIDGDALRVRARRRSDDQEIRSRISRINGADVTVTNVDPVSLHGGHAVRFRDILPGVSWEVFHPERGSVAQTVILDNSIATPWSCVYEVLSEDLSGWSVNLNTNAQMCLDNSTMTASVTKPTQPTDPVPPGMRHPVNQHRFLEMVITPLGQDTVDRQGVTYERIRVRKRWTGKVSDIDPVTRVLSWVDDPSLIEWPVRIR